GCDLRNSKLDGAQLEGSNLDGALMPQRFKT
ncbi:MAG: pentapeptide repeat-containing protein, partial [Prochlorococcus sp.]